MLYTLIDKILKTKENELNNIPRKLLVVQIGSVTVIIMDIPTSASKLWHNCYLFDLYFTDAMVKLYGEDSRSAICDAICRVLRGVGD